MTLLLSKFSASTGFDGASKILFKAFKQHLNLGQVKETTPYQVELLIYARLILITHLLNFVYGPLRHYSNTSLSSPLSILKFSYWFDFFAPYFFILSFIPKDQIIPPMAQTNTQTLHL